MVSAMELGKQKLEDVMAALKLKKELDEENKKKVIAEVIRFIITVLGALLGTSALQSCGLL